MMVGPWKLALRVRRLGGIGSGLGEGGGPGEGAEAGELTGLGVRAVMWITRAGWREEDGTRPELEGISRGRERPGVWVWLNVWVGPDQRSGLGLRAGLVPGLPKKLVGRVTTVEVKRSKSPAGMNQHRTLLKTLSRFNSLAGALKYHCRKSR